MDKDIFLKLEKELMGLCGVLSIERIKQLIADDFLEYGSSGGIYTKEDLKDGISLKNYQVLDFSMVTLTDKCVHVRYKTINRKETQVLRSSIWICDKGNWKMAFHQGTHC